MKSMFAVRNDLDLEFEKESDRGCAILTICLLEETLATLFAKVLPHGEKSARSFMPRGRLALGTANAHALGLLDDHTLKNFKAIIEIRNIFAHKLLGGISFASPEIASKVQLLELPNMDAVPETVAELSLDSRKRYMLVVDSIFFTLEWMIGRAKPLPSHQIPRWVISRAPSGG